MKTIPTFLVLCLLPASQANLLAADPTVKGAPPSIMAPASQTPLLVLTAKGVQIYECRPTAVDPTKYEWAFKAPEADLFDVHGTKVGRHYAGPTWELNDGSKVTGKLKSKADAPDHKGIPWLLLEAVQPTGPQLAKVQTIRRVDTVGGDLPKTAPDASQGGKEVRVDYTATYEFYGPKP